MKKYVGIDLGGTNIAAGVVDEEGNILRKCSRKTGAERPFPEIVADMAETAREAAALAGLSMDDVEAVGVGTPSCVDPGTGLLVHANNLGWHNVPLPAELKKHFSVPVFIGNDADCAALGEVLAGAARGLQNAVMITLGTGVGGGVISDGRIYNGGDHMGGELGHTKLVFGGERCTCGQSGCFEAYASATALIRQTKEAIAAHPESALLRCCGGNLEAVTARTAFDAAKAGDETALAVVDRYITYLAAGLSSLVAIFRPQAVILGGGVSNEGDYLLSPLNRRLAEVTFAAEEIGVPPVVQAELGNDAGVIGAALLGRSPKT